MCCQLDGHSSNATSYFTDDLLDDIGMLLPCVSREYFGAKCPSDAVREYVHDMLGHMGATTFIPVAARITAGGAAVEECVQAIGGGSLLDALHEEERSEDALAAVAAAGATQEVGCRVIDGWRKRDELVYVVFDVTLTAKHMHTHTHSLTHSFTHTHSLLHSHSHTSSLTHSLSHTHTFSSLTHSLTYTS